MENIDTDANAMLNEELEALEKKIMLIGTADIEKFKEFMDRLKAIQSSTIGMSKKDFDNVKFSIIQNLTKLQFDFNSYMDGTETTDIGTKQVSGKSKIKSYRIGLYTSIVNDFKKIDEIDIEKLRSLKEKWNEEKQDDYLNYLPIEQSLVEEAMADAFLTYQIKYVQKNGKLPQEKYQEFTTIEEYTSSIKKELLKVATSNTVDEKTKLDIEKYLMVENLDSSLKEEKLWKILSQKDNVFIDKAIDEKKDEKADKTIAIVAENQSLVSKTPSFLQMIINKLKPKYLDCTIKTKGFLGLGEEKEKQVKIKLKTGPRLTDFESLLPRRYNEKITSVVVPEGVKELRTHAFCDCINLKKVVLPSTLTKIGYSAFSGCKSLTDINLPSTITEIDEFAFCDCESLTTLNLPDNLTSINDTIFSGCYNLEKIKFPSQLQEIMPMALANLGIKEVDLSHVKHHLTIYHSAFARCDKLETVKLPESMTRIRDNIFFNCTSLKNIEFSKDLKSIHDSAFKNCISLTEMMNLPDTVTEIYDSAFEGCSKLKQFKMPAYLRDVSEIAFDSNHKFDRFILPKQLMNINVFKRLQIDDDSIFELPEDAKGFAYDSLGLSVGEKISFSDFKKAISPNTQNKKSRSKNRRKESQKRIVTTLHDNKDEPEI